MAQDESLLRHAIGLAGTARDRGNHPFGALLADASGELLLEAQNTVVTESGATGHAETNLVRLAGRRPVEVRGLYALPEALEVHRGFWNRAG